METTEIRQCFTGPLDKNTSDDDLYRFFIEHIFYSNMRIEGVKVRCYATPVTDGKIQGYFHLTTREEKRLGMKIRLTEKRRFYINHVVPMIKNYKDCQSCQNTTCQKIKIWTVPFKGKKRTKLLYSCNEYSYLLILEHRKKENDLVIITSFLVDEPRYLEDILEEYRQNKKAP